MKTAPTIDYQDAKRIVEAIVQKALEHQKSVTAVSDAHGELIAWRGWMARRFLRSVLLATWHGPRLANENPPTSSATRFVIQKKL
jgi:hypothetical protein